MPELLASSRNLLRQIRCWIDHLSIGDVEVREENELNGVYTKAYVIALSHSLQHELSANTSATTCLGGRGGWRARRDHHRHRSAEQCCRLSSFLMENNMTTTSPEQNKAVVLEAFDTLFNKRDYAAAERFWSERYIQHSAHIPPGRDGLFNLVRGLPETLRYENHVILAEGDYVIAHGRFSGHGRPSDMDRR